MKPPPGLGVYRDNGKEKWKLLQYNRVYVMTMEKKMERTMVYWGIYGDNGKENGNYRDQRDSDTGAPYSSFYSPQYIRRHP